MKLDATSLTSRYVAHVGFVSTTRYFHDVVQEFLRVAPVGYGDQTLHCLGRIFPAEVA